MSVQSDKVARRKRKTPQRRTPAIIEERERKPFLFGRGHDLTKREREAIKERIALFGGIALAIVLAGILGWGWLQDNVITPNQIAAENNKVVAIVGNDTIRLGFYKKYESFEQTQLQNQQTQLTQEINTLNATSKKTAAQTSELQQLQAQQSLVQQQLGSLASDTLTALVNNDIVLQRSAAAGVPITPALVNNAMKNVEIQAGGRQHLISVINQSGLTYNQFKQQFIVAPALDQKIQSKLASTVSRYQIKVRASHILIPATKKALAEKLYHEALSGANFAQLARKYSTDPGSKTKGGDLGWFAHGTMVAPFDKAAFSMKVGQIRLVKSQFGWHIIKLTGRKRARLTASEYSQAQQSAFQGWLAKEKSALHFQQIMATSSLPQPVATANPLTNIAPSVPSNVNTNPAPAVTKPHTTTKGKGAKSSHGKHK